MNAKIIERTATLYGQADCTQPKTELVVGTQLDIGKLVTRNGIKTVTVALSDGQKGYIPADTKVFMIRNATLLQDSSDIREQPSSASQLKMVLKKGAQIQLEDQVEGDGRKWVKIRDKAGLIGYMDGSTKVSVQQGKAQSSPEKDMTVGAIWCIIGAIVTAVTYSMATSSPGGGTYFVAWGAILFGGIQFLKGLFRFLTKK